LWAYADSALGEKRLPQYTDLTSKTVLFSFDKRKYTLNDWANYLQAIRNVRELVSGKTKEELLQTYVEASAEDYYRSHLEQYNSAFAHQLEEFRNGNLLFECMQRNVWTKASDDTAGLRKYFDNNYNRYWWQPGADAVFFSSNDEKSISELYKKIDTDKKNWRSLAKDYDNIVQADSGRFEYSQFPISGADKLGDDFVTAPVKNASDNSYTFLYLVKKHTAREHRNFDDARGFALNDYQNYLEEEWIISLKKKYPVKVNEAVLQSLWKEK
jgi:peptidyl-prolyl cis-trans isomerase SurA